MPHSNFPRWLSLIKLHWPGFKKTTALHETMMVVKSLVGGSGHECRNCLQPLKEYLGMPPDSGFSGEILNFVENQGSLWYLNFSVENWTGCLPPPSSGIIKSPHIKLGGIVNVSNLSFPVTVHDRILNGTGEVKDLLSNKLILRYHLSNLEASIICFELIKSQNMRMSLKHMICFLQKLSLGLYENSPTIPVKTQRQSWYKAVHRVRSSCFLAFCPLEVLFL